MYNGNASLIAAEKGHEACVRVLIAANANVAYKDRNGNSALHCAAQHRRALICRVLVDEGASLTAVNSTGKTPLELAKVRGNAECVAILEAAAASASAAMGGAV